MKHLSFFTAAFLASATALLAGAPNNVFNAVVKGTITKQVLLSPGDSRISVETLDEKRMFQEFLLSPDQYVLVLDASGSGELLFRSKSASAALPDVPVLAFGEGATVINSKTGEARLDRAFSSPSTDTVFKDLGGTAGGAFTFIPPLGLGIQVKKLNMRFTGHGTDESTSPAGRAILKFKLSTTSRFEQKP